ncbi:unnamed protein product, partial [marine sediment metagenome]
AIARAMRRTALGAMCAMSAPERIKRQVHKIEVLLAIGKTEQEICSELKIGPKILMDLKVLINTESWDRLFNEPTYDPESFLIIDDLMSSHYLTEKDKAFIQAQFEGNMDSLGLTRKQRWSQMKSFRPKLVRSGYGN